MPIPRPSPSGLMMIATISDSSSHPRMPPSCPTSRATPVSWSGRWRRISAPSSIRVAVDHWNTQHPHVHIIVRGVADDGQDLVISRDYIKEGMRARAQDLVTQELGLRSDLDIRRALDEPG